MTETSLLQDFIVETAEHLDEMEANLLRLEAADGRRARLDDIFRAAHTIKGAAEYLGLVRMAELSHRLENLLDLLRQNAREVDRPMMDLLMACRDRLAGLNGELEQSQLEQTGIDDLVARIQAMQTEAPPSAPAPAPVTPVDAPDEDVYAEESDPELFAIFKAQLAEGLAALQKCCGQLAGASDGNHQRLVAECEALLDPLRASANYMGYDNLAARYDAWRAALQAARPRLAEDDGAWRAAFAAELLESHLAPIAARFPDLELAAPAAPPVAAPAAAPSMDGIPAPAMDMAPAASAAAAPGPEPDEALFEQLSRSFDQRRQQQAPAATAAGGPLADELFSDAAGAAVVPDDASTAVLNDEDAQEAPEDDDLDLTAAYAAAAPATERTVRAPEAASAAPAPEATSEATSEATTQSAAAAPLPKAAADTPSPTVAGSADEEAYVEENDAELFHIFQDHLTQGLSALQALADRIQAAPADPQPLLAEGLRQITALRASANYMGYHHLTATYDQWHEALQRVGADQPADSDGLAPERIAAALRGQIAAVAAHFPDCDLIQAPTLQASSEAARESFPADGARPETASAPAPPPERAPDAPAPHEGAAAGEENYAEETDQELFQIFKDQLAEGLAALQTCTAALGAAPADADETLAHCLTLIDPLRSSANYMGYERLTAHYDAWRQALEEARQRLTNGDRTDLETLAGRLMPQFIAEVTARFPEIELPPTAAPEDESPAAPADPPAPSAEEEEAPGRPALDNDDPTPAAETSLLQDFIVETGEHLEEMENSLLRLEADHDRRETLDDLFRAAHTIKGAAEYLGMTRMAELSHRLENLLDLMRRNVRPVDRPMVDLLMACHDRLAVLIAEIDQSRSEQSAIDDLTARIAHMQETPADPADEALPAPEAAEVDFSEETAQAAIQAFFDAPAESAAATTPAAAAAAGAPEEDLAPAPGDRRDPAQGGRRRSDRTGERLIKQSIRVDAGKIDALMNQVGELVVSRAWFAQLFSEMRELQQSLKQSHRLESKEMKQVKGLTFRLSEATVALGRVANELQEGVMKVRMLPIAQLFNRYPRLVYDLVRDSGKEVNLDIRGEETELDKMVIEAISDPLIHIIRNAVDHGIETADDRRQRGKPAAGTIRLEAYHEGNHVVIEITDDGRGLDLEKIRAKALAGGFATREELERIDDKETVQFIMEPGFSTAESVTHTSGRGVGMDVVKKNIEKLNGTIEIDSVPGMETRLRIKIPLTLAIIPALLVKVRGELFTVPLSTVEETLRIFPDDIATIEGMEVLQLRENTLPLVRLPELFNLTAPAPDARRTFVVVVSTGIKRVGLVVDELLGQEEVVIKPLEDYVQERSGFSGATILGDGRISLILDVYELVNLSIARQTRRKKQHATA